MRVSIYRTEPACDLNCSPCEMRCSINAALRDAAWRHLQDVLSMRPGLERCMHLRSATARWGEQPSLFVPRERGIKRVNLIEHALKHCRENLLSGQSQRIRRSRPLLLKGFEHLQYEGAFCTFQRFRSGHKPAILDWKVWRGRRVYRGIIDLAEKISCARTKLARDINDGS